MKPALGLAHGLASVTNSNACFRLQSLVCMRYARARVIDLDLPSWQCRRSLPPLCSASLMKSVAWEKKGIISCSSTSCSGYRRHLHDTYTSALEILEQHVDTHHLSIPRPIKLLRTSLASSDMLHMHLALAGMRFGDDYYALQPTVDTATCACCAIELCTGKTH